ncbi:cytochrome P450 [Nonomuraea terrae]|uniref:Cytochrome P450 n=1 Tax=Nonomuraea terrae TaxID=2530383 RepID=A0A4R4ZA69_9ACTN|nr:cytochrome P450 [Nonomuraea terrae]TDD54194.1 cytochrome P450 [Nonomuraea terrae]
MQDEHAATPLPAYPFPRTSAIEPPPALAELRAAGPLHRVQLADGRQAWLVTRYDEVRTLLGHPAFGTQYPGTVPMTESEDNLAAGFMFLKDPPEHTRLRRSVTRAFTARRVAELRRRAMPVAADLVDQMLARGPEADVMEALAYPLPITMISELLGIAAEDRGRFRRWSDLILRSVEGGSDEEMGAAFLDLQQFVVKLVDGKPDGTDLVSDLARHSGEPDGLTRLEIAAMAMGLLMAGYVTTASAISHALLRLLGSPQVMAQVRAGQIETTRLVEELLRLQDEEVGINRIAQQDVEICGVRIARGDTVIISRAGANRDPGAFPDPTAISAGAERGPHLAFGHGIHHCLGAALARMELEVALGTLITKIPGIRLAVPPAELEWSCDGMDVSIKRLPVTW